MNFMIQELKSHGYNIVMTAGSASKEKCRQNGTNREMKEGKKYSSLSWSGGGQDTGLFRACQGVSIHNKPFCNREHQLE